mmetsp:Transcript_13871/g.30241  ORF Transcript_13871/g.30241 Transcript_13871/m.30241 type:complete len:778 (+) Transcript_13871:163-2496(+)
MPMSATFYPPNLPSLLQRMLQLLLCCSAAAHDVARSPLQASISSSSSCSGFVSTSRIRNRERKHALHWFNNDNRRRISPSSSRYLPLAAASQKLVGDTTQKSDGTDDNFGAQIDDQKKLETDIQLENIDGFQFLIQKAVETLVMSDTDGEELKHSTGSASQGLWIHAPAAKEMQGVLDKVVLKMPQDVSIDSQSLQNELSIQWLQWMKTIPSPLFLELTTHIHEMITLDHETENPWVSDEHLKSINMSLEQYISRIACRVILLPSGSETSSLSLVESAGGHIYGKLLYGGVSRFRLLKSGKTMRRAGESREVMSPNRQQQQYSHPSWVQLGGLERKYEAIDMGPAAILELTLLPSLWQQIPTIFNKSILLGDACSDMTMTDAAFGWDPSTIMQLLPEEEDKSDNEVEAGPSSTSVFESLEGQQRNEALTTHFQSRVGGLQPQIDAIVRRVLDGRSIYATHSEDDTDKNTINKARLEAEELSLLGLQPVRGLLLYGRPGVGKTLIVREIARVLTSRPVKIIAASELLDRWVGGSERLVRDLFQDAEDELKMCQQMAAGAGEVDKAFLNSALHVIVIDEIDAVFRKRIDSSDSGSVTRNSVVNQLLAKLDGVHALPNVLMIGMTNMRELLDPALLRPGRLEVQIEIPLPNRSSRKEILQIHFGALRTRNRLSYPLRCAIDGVASSSDEETPGKAKSSRERKRRVLKQAASSVVDFISTRHIPVYDLADETEGFSGADIEGLVRCAGSRALSRARKDGCGVESLLITLDDVKQGLIEVKM